MQITDDASLGELVEDLIMPKENIEDVAISHFDDSLGNLNNLPETMKFFQSCSLVVYYVTKLSTVDNCILIFQLLGKKQLLMLRHNSRLRSGFCLLTSSVQTLSLYKEFRILLNEYMLKNY